MPRRKLKHEAVTRLTRLARCDGYRGLTEPLIFFFVVLPVCKTGTP
jgi:hypothetical protein